MISILFFVIITIHGLFSLAIGYNPSLLVPSTTIPHRSARQCSQKIFLLFIYFFFSFQSLLCYSTPNTHPYISKKELNYLNANVTSSDNKGIKDPVPWRAILTSAPVWALVWAAVSLITFLPWF